MVDAHANWALETLRDLLIEEVKLLSGAEGQVKEVGRELLAMRDFLKDSDKWPDRYNSARVRRWVSKLMDLATRAEDVLEQYDVEVAPKREAKGLKKMLKRFTCILGECSALHDIGNETADILSRMAKLTEELESIRKTSSSSESNDDQRSRKTYDHEIEEHFVGMENDIDQLVSYMKNNDRSYRVISICGMGGLGKTTLARKIYHHKDILFGFKKARAWVCITQKLQATAIFKDILSQLLGENINEGEEAELVRKLYHVQIENKCLVVLDDIWETDHWDILKKAFPLAESESKILLTTREHEVAKIGFVYDLKCLTEDESWDLLQKIALPFHQSQGLRIENLKQFEEVGRELVRKCGCLPLLVSVIGGNLRPSPCLPTPPPCLEDWKIVLKDMDSYLKHGKGVNANDKRVEQVLSLSYNLLPYYLKFCFLYLGCFPEDEDIDVEDVYLIWMAEGLISSDDKGQNETLRDVAKRYLNELGSKCMVQVKLKVDTIYFENFKSCRLHDLVRELCLSKGKEENFFKDSQGKIRRLAINLVDDGTCGTVEQFKNSNLRSLLLVPKWRYGGYDITKIWKNLLSNALLRSLKVLVLEHCTFVDKKLPDSVRKLVMLKHLSIRYSNIVELPEFVFKLPRLQSMDLRMLQRVMLPNSIDKMSRLRHLFLTWSKMNIDGRMIILDGSTTINDGERPRLDGFTELETLIGFSSKVFDTNHLLLLINLRSFGGSVYDIESLSVVVDHFTKLKDKLREASLEICVTDLSSEEGTLLIDSLMHFPLNYLQIEGQLSRLPPWDPQLLQNLNTLILVDSKMGNDPMETLQLLPSLRDLLLGCDAFAGTEMVCKSKGFPHLKTLRLLKLSNLEGWRVEGGAMPNLSDLTIRACRKLKMIPEEGIMSISITKLTISGMPSNFMKRLISEGEDYHKISHIPFLDLGSFNNK